VTFSREALLALGESALAEAGEAEVEIFLRTSHRGIARFAHGELGQHMILDEPYAAVRVARGARVAEAGTSRLDRDGLVGAIAEAAKAARVVPETAGFTGFAAANEPTGQSPPRFAKATAEAGAEERVDLLLPAMSAIARAGLVSAGALETRVTTLAVATTRGLSRAHASTLANFKVWALETPGAGGAAGYGAHAHRDVSALDVQGETERAIRLCVMGKDPISLEAGAYDVVMDPSAIADLLEWLSSIAFGAPEFEQGTSPLAGRIGERITGDAVTIVEDPLDPGDLGLAAPFDREGVWRQRVPLVEEGIARAVLFDRIHAARMSAVSTGSSLAPDASGGAGVGACALHLKGGTAEGVDELIAGVDRGIYVCRLHYVNGLLEPRRAVMTGLTRDGCFLIERGKLTRPVGNLRFTDSFLEGLARSDGMTRGQVAVPTWWSDAGASVAPAVRMRAFRFNGKSQEPRRPNSGY
jgi:predicted Zn-dependent protease